MMRLWKGGQVLNLWIYEITDKISIAQREFKSNIFVAMLSRFMKLFKVFFS